MSPILEERTHPIPDILLSDMRDFDLDQTLDCGQSFRWEKQETGHYRGIVEGAVCEISKTGNVIRLHSTTPAKFDSVWRNYFDLDRDYAAIKERFCQDETLRKAVSYAPGIRLLRQPPWETLCSFIISQNNNVPRIKGIVTRMCETFGEPIAEHDHAFPVPQTIAALSVDDLAPLRAGFRAKYLLSAAQLVAAGEIDLDALYTLPLDQARPMLMKIHGVGPKVAECVLLYGFSRVECFPLDVWMKRAMIQIFPDGLPSCTQGLEGIAQQYIFHYVRTCKTALTVNNQ